MRVVMIGDIHGCIRSFEELLKLIDPVQGDRIISVGDLVHKGPDSASVVKLCRELKVELVLGNHEADQNGWHRRHHPMHPHGEGNAVLEAQLSEADVEYLHSASLWLEVPGGIAIHGGVMPKWKQLSDITQRACWVRNLTADGRFLPSNRTQPGSYFWAEKYDGALGTVYFGHTPFKRAERPVRFEHAVGVDLGCVKGNRLAAVDTDGNEYVVPCLDR